MTPRPASLATPSQQRSLLLDFMEQIRRYQKLNNFIESAYDTSLSLMEGHLLLELEQAGDTSISSLSTTLRVHPGAMTRAVRRLLTIGVIQSTKSAHDSRRSIIRRLPAADAVMVPYDQRAESSIAQLAEVLTPGEKRALRSGLLALYRASGGSPPFERKHEHSLRAPIRGITRALGLLELRPPYSKLSVLEWQILSELALARRKLSTQELHDELAVAYERITYSLRALTQRRLLSHHPSKKDARFSEYELSTAGRNAVTATQNGFLEMVANEWAPPAVADIRLVVDLFTKMTMARASSSLSQLSVKTLSSAAELSDARALYATEWLLGKLSEQFFPERLCSECNTTIGVYKGRKLIAFAERQSAPNVLIRRVICSQQGERFCSEATRLLENSA